MLIINNVKLPLDTDFEDLKTTVEKLIKCKTDNVYLYKKSVDARRKDNVHFCCSVLVECANEQVILKKNKNAQLYICKDYKWQTANKMHKNPPVVVGFGPCGMFCALALARAGLKPIVLERGQDADTRKKDVDAFFTGGKLNPESNVQFGEGGAGTFSDGKLNTGIKDIRCRAVLKEFVCHGAKEKILTDAKPHIGTDILIDVVKSIRKEIISLGGKVLFGTKLEKINISNNVVTSVVANGQEILCENVVLATGHSARDVFELLRDSGVEMQQKAFSVGVRIEHLQENINKALYGKFYNHPALSSADYKLSTHLENGRGVYTFCMCPGGEVINASSEEGKLAVNGMSYSRRDGKNANSAVLVGVTPQDFPSDDVLAGCELQRVIEEKAYNICKGAVPVTTVGNLVFGKEAEITEVVPTVKPSYAFADFCDIFPSYIIQSLKQGILDFDKKINGFASYSAVLTAPETRSSSPVRILRNENFQSVNLDGLYPAGEGAGYAGGIMSAAVDGIKVAEYIIGM
ncbi:MAG: FAD-dependent oxidoreductase [Clostridia bacterium]|nr:FAD-dependent oxidoreductase [Clostridia bacterium]